VGSICIKDLAHLPTDGPWRESNTKDGSLWTYRSLTGSKCHMQHATRQRGLARSGGLNVGKIYVVFSLHRSETFHVDRVRNPTACRFTDFSRQIMIYDDVALDR
jgi:hypothetical protein